MLSTLDRPWRMSSFPWSPLTLGGVATKEEEWYYVDDATNTYQGPRSINELGKLFAASSVTSSTLVWRDGQEDWSPLLSPKLLSLHNRVILKAREGPVPLPEKSAGGGGDYAGGAGHVAWKTEAVVQTTPGEFCVILQQLCRRAFHAHV